MATFKEMQDRISLDYLNRSNLGNECKRAIIRAIKFYEKDRYWFNVTSTALPVTTATTSMAIPADFIALDFATVTNNGVEDLMVIRTYDRIAYNNRNNASGVPAEICYWKNALFISPKPSSATSVTIHYTHTLPALSADTDTNAWTSAGEDVIVYRATYDLMANVLRLGDQGVIDRYKAMEMEALQMLQHGNNLRQGVKMDEGSTGTNHNQSPKLPHKPAPTQKQ